MTEARTRVEREPGTGLAPALESRLAAVAAHGERADFDGISWLWMCVFGLLLPIVLLVIGWWL